jgi:hypothetical protein
MDLVVKCGASNLQNLKDYLCNQKSIYVISACETKKQKKWQKLGISNIMNIMNFTNCNNKLISVSNTYTALKISTKINETNVLGVHVLLF